MLRENAISYVPSVELNMRDGSGAKADRAELFPVAGAKHDKEIRWDFVDGMRFVLGQFQKQIAILKWVQDGDGWVD
jgi:hypothetical protein